MLANAANNGVKDICAIVIIINSTHHKGWLPRDNDRVFLALLLAMRSEFAFKLQGLKALEFAEDLSFFVAGEALEQANVKMYIALDRRSIGAGIVRGNRKKTPLVGSHQCEIVKELIKVRA